ncbi:hypothetical protein [Helicobacter ailurogastricus]|uniref:hypothetical protein n=1 Tax=Helicobacter ailurogastricus TaxID=1578720 RepID=UPI00249264A8|nr:hypothetical protein [Helicobacter ailurogastricus]
MKILALIFFPWAFFALRGKYWLAIFAFLIQLSLLGWVISIVWVITSHEYKNFDQLPRGTFPSIFFPFATFFKQGHHGLGFLSLLCGSFVSPFIGVLSAGFLVQMSGVSDDMTKSIIGLSVLLSCIIWPCCSISALKSVGVSSVAQSTINNQQSTINNQQSTINNQSIFWHRFRTFSCFLTCTR